MSNRIDLSTYWQNPPDLLPSVSIDCVIFGFHDNQLKILLLEYKNSNTFALPGGFVNLDEDLNQSAERVLLNRTGLENIYLEQFYTFGNKSRQDDDLHRRIMASRGEILPEKHFILNRFISVGYYALIDFSKANPSPDALSDSCDWFDIATIPSLMLDHNDIVQKALETLRLRLDEKLVGLSLLPDRFTMNELQSLYETILGTKLIRSNFQRKILSLGVLKRIEKKFTGAANKAPYLYEFIK